ncbi:hypothetical protein GLS_c05620 [Gluconobacter oxydans DSM 3504]|uniref:Uncharacterized protein n=1 Tax=Gluconobacter oxydans DSM 3504 TaxID=1288313 RepID=A0A067Z309_GLUOY|nr:hypothetical protein GLS_c05620 [Gluconobacter oxydans DSM 3504]
MSHQSVSVSGCFAGPSCTLHGVRSSQAARGAIFTELTRLSGHRPGYKFSCPNDAP